MLFSKLEFSMLYVDMQSHRANPPGREFRLLPGRDRERSLILDSRPNTTHTVYRVCYFHCRYLCTESWVAVCI